MKEENLIDTETKGSRFMSFLFLFVIAFTYGFLLYTIGNQQMDKNKLRKEVIELKEKVKALQYWGETLINACDIEGP